MMTHNENNDHDVRDVLSRLDHGEAYDPIRQEGMRDLLVSTFRGKMKWVSILLWIYIFLFGGLTVYCAVNFFLEETIKYQIAYAVGFLWFATLIGVCKMWYWMFMIRQSVLKSVARVEARLAAMEDHS
ncbi:MAG: DUF6768 family protein [Phycisphaerae bacterium]